ncbi:MAG: hypothetical protein ACR2NL_11905 [Acidimicrobiia bacterium]
MFDALPHNARSNLAEGMRRAWRRMGAAGTWWSGRERVAIAEVFRAAQAGETAVSAVLSDVAVEAARRLAVEPAATTAAIVAGQPAAGMEHAAYVELTGVVSRLAAIDAVHRALGADLEPLPTPEAGEPTRTPQPAQARQGKAFVPMVGGASIVGALSLVPDEMEAQRDIHGPLYMSYEDMAEYDYQGGLHRTQLELVAGRTSAINDCFY